MKRQTPWSVICVVLAAVLTGACTTKLQLTTCTNSSGCSATQFCTGGSCYPKFASGTCNATSEHDANDVCTSGLCLAGACCTSACASTDADCKATSCDPTSGACVYPSSTATCGPAESCTSGAHTPASSCNGQGACTLVQPTPCASHSCFDTHRCVASCTDNSGCAATEFCSSGQCAPKLAPGAVCGPTSTSPLNSDCASGACLGTRCCSTACNTTDTQCGATDCDSTGACAYPAQTVTCGALQSCTGSSYTPQSACDGKGACKASPPQSCEPYVCNEPGAICQASCTLGGSECAADSYCDAQHCALKGGPGRPCATTSTSNADQACLSSICSANCCVIDCAADPVTNNCKGTCDAAGACAPRTCPNNFGCSGTVTCNTQCATSADCDAQAFCDPVGASACCSRYNKGDTIYIDGVDGDDTPCCGAQATPCQTVSHAMSMIATSGTSGLFLWVLNGDGTTSWTANEKYPIHLGWGVTLHAPSIHFTNQTYQSDTFQVYAYDVTDTATVTIQGGANGIAADAIGIGFDAILGYYNNSKIGVNDAVNGKTALPLILSEAWLSSNASQQSYDLSVSAGVTVTLGPNPVYMGNGNLIGSPPDHSLRGPHGIYCKGAGASIQDDPAATNPVLWIETRYEDFIDIEDGCTATLTQGPRFGGQEVFPSGWDGTGSSCPAGDYCTITCDEFANYGAVVAGSGSVTFGSEQMPGSIVCSNYGFDEETSDAIGSPTVIVSAAMIDLQVGSHYLGSHKPPYGGYGQACAGAMVTEGTFSATATTFTHSLLGVFVGGNALSVDLSGGGKGGNTFTCNDANTWGQNYQSACGSKSNIVPPVGAGVVNASATIGISASNGVWEEYDSTANTTQVWSCTDTTYSDCTCSGASCYGATDIPLPDGADSVYVSTNIAATPLDTSAGSQTTVPCP